MKKPFISYRWSDNDTRAIDLIAARLRARFGNDAVFFDTITPGHEIEDEIKAGLAKCDVVLAFIGKTWVDRLRNPKSGKDWLQFELDYAIRKEIPVIWLLEEGVEMPNEEDLPPNLKPILKKLGTIINLDRSRLDHEISHIIHIVELEGLSQTLERIQAQNKFVQARLLELKQTSAENHESTQKSVAEYRELLRTELSRVESYIRTNWLDQDKKNGDMQAEFTKFSDAVATEAKTRIADSAAQAGLISEARAADIKISNAIVSEARKRISEETRQDTEIRSLRRGIRMLIALTALAIVVALVLFWAAMTSRLQLNSDLVHDTVQVEVGQAIDLELQGSARIDRARLSDSKILAWEPLDGRSKVRLRGQNPGEATVWLSTANITEVFTIKVTDKAGAQSK